MSDYDEYDDESYGEWDDWGEAPRRSRRASTARATTPMPRSSGRAVTQTQFQVAIQQVNAAINKNSAAIQKVNTGVNGLEGTVRRQGRALKEVNKDLGRLRDIATIVPLLVGSIGQQNQQLATIFPLLLAQGIGDDNGGYGGGSGDGGLFGGGSSGLLLLLVLLGGLGGHAGSRRPRRRLDGRLGGGRHGRQHRAVDGQHQRHVRHDQQGRLMRPAAAGS